jgi:diguanylate cyclase (GGDEF)-like protein
MVHLPAIPFQRYRQKLSECIANNLNFGCRAILVSSLLALTCVSAGKRFNLFQHLELTSFDYLTRLQPRQLPDNRLLIVEITEKDLEALGWPLSDQLVAEAIDQIQQFQPAVIGLDLYRNTPQPPGKAALMQEFQQDNVIGIMNAGNQPDNGEVEAPEGLPPERIGFNDLAIDPDGVLRRNLIFVGNSENAYYSFPLRLVLAYHNDLDFRIDPNGQFVAIGEAQFPVLNKGDGGYAHIDNRGYQILMRFRNPDSPAKTLSISKALAGEIPPEWVKGNIVMIGSTASSLKDEFFTPYSLDQTAEFVMSGVEIHAQSVSQLLDVVAGRSALYRFMPQWGEFLWLLGWSLVAATLGWYMRRPVLLLGVSAAITVGIWSFGGMALLHLVWVPTIEPIAVFSLALALVVGQKALYRTTYDQLTLLPGRDVFLINLQQQLAHQPMTAHHFPLAVVFLDIDRFRLINQSFGHPLGDKVLRIFARRLAAALPDSAHLARMEGDEFAFLLPVYDRDNLEKLLIHIQAELSKPMAVAKHLLSTSSSMGIVLVDGPPFPKPEELLRDAHTAMYRAKALNEYRYEIFAPTMHAEAVRRLELESHLLHAFEKHEFLLHYQPIVCLQTRTILGFEALVRWYREGEGFISPGQFIQVVEETGLIINLGQWIFKEACQQLATWKQEFHRQDLKMSINLSRRQFLQADLVEQFSATLSALRLPGQCIQLEITESMIMGDIEKAEQLMNRLKDLGLQLAIDDFGTGYSSLSYLHRFPTDTLKIDQSFVGQMDGSQEDQDIVHTIVSLGRKLGMNLVAEGIETEVQVNLLQMLGCDLGQGYLFARPLGARQATALLVEQSTQRFASG